MFTFHQVESLANFRHDLVLHHRDTLHITQHITATQKSTHLTTERAFCGRAGSRRGECMSPSVALLRSHHNHMHDTDTHTHQNEWDAE